MTQVEVQHTAENCVPGRPFTRGTDSRRNTRGRPKTFDALRELCQKICHEKVTLDGEVLSRLEVVLRDWSTSKDVQKQIALVQYGYGKPVDRIETNLEPKTRLILRFAHEADRELSPFDCLPPNVAREMQRRLKGPEAPNGEGTCRP